MVASTPYWIVEKNYKAVSLSKVQKGIAKLSKLKVQEEQQALEPNEVSFDVLPIDIGSPEYNNGRKGEIVLKSQNATCIITVYQTKKSIF
jgi:hypothetical protein